MAYLRYTPRKQQTSPYYLQRIRELKQKLGSLIGHEIALGGEVFSIISNEVLLCESQEPYVINVCSMVAQWLQKGHLSAVNALETQIDELCPEPQELMTLREFLADPRARHFSQKTQVAIEAWLAKRNGCSQAAGANEHQL